MSEEVGRNYVLGQGRLYLDDGDGERYLGDSPGFAVEPEVERTQVYSTDAAVEQLAIDVVRRIDRRATIEVKNITPENLGLFLIAELDEITQAATAVTDEEFASVKQGRWYQLGATAANPTGVRSISDVTVTAGNADAATVADTDYQVDATLGRIYIIPTSAKITDDTKIKVDYTPKATKRWQLKSTAAGGDLFKMRYISENLGPAAPQMDLYAPQVLVAPSGGLALLDRDQPAQISLQCSFQQPSSGAAVYIDGRAA